MENEGHDEQKLRTTGLAFFGRITASISHEISNVLATVGELSGLLQDLILAGQKSGGVDPERLQRFADGLTAQVQKGAVIVKRLNRFARGADYATKTVDLREQLEAIIDLAQRAAALKQVRLETDLADQPILLDTNPFLLQQAVFHCIEMALRCSNPGEAVILSSRQGESIAEIQVAARSIIQSEELDASLSLLVLLMQKLGGTARYLPAEDGTRRLVLTIPRGGSADSAGSTS